MIPSQSCLEHRHDFKFPWRRENITPIQMTQGTCYHQLMLQQIFNLFTTESSWAAWNSALLKNQSSLGQSLEQLEEVTLDCPDLELLSGSISKESISTWRERHTAPVPGRLSEWKLKSIFPSCKNPQEKSTDNYTVTIILVTLCTQSDCCLLKPPKWSSVCL